MAQLPAHDIEYGITDQYTSCNSLHRYLFVQHHERKYHDNYNTKLIYRYKLRGISDLQRTIITQSHTIKPLVLIWL